MVKKSFQCTAPTTTVAFLNISSSTHKINNIQQANLHFWAYRDGIDINLFL